MSTTVKTRTLSMTRDAIRKRNAAFEKLPPEKKRVTIAKDVIKALNAKRITPKQNYYLQVGYADDGDVTNESDAQTALLEGKLKCDVCALGSVFVCAVERMNKLKVGDLYNDKYKMMDYLSGVFDSEQLDLIECAFERTRNHACTELDDDEARRAIELGRKFETRTGNCGCGDPKCTVKRPDSEACMRAIMENIIANGGTFIP